jgi:periplasmic protein TonB
MQEINVSQQTYFTLHMNSQSATIQTQMANLTSGKHIQSTRRILLRFLFALVVITLSAAKIMAQEIVNLVLVGDDGITEDLKKAHSFIVVKKLNNQHYERLDYKRGAPALKIRTYQDSSLQVLDGRHLEYFPSGYLHYFGSYAVDKKSGRWRTYNDTGKVVLIEDYENGTLVKAENPDTTRKVKSDSFPDQHAAEMKGGQKSWMKYLVKRLEVAQAAEKSTKGGTVRVAFAIDTTGKIVDTYLMKSAEFVLDEEAIDVIEKSPSWEPAFQNGRHIKAYRIQPLTFVKD